jgi:protein-tyrosine-phosphatase
MIGRRGGDRFEAASAGTEPAAEVHPFTIEALLRSGINWRGRRPKGSTLFSANDGIS